MRRGSARLLNGGTDHGHRIEVLPNGGFDCFYGGPGVNGGTGDGNDTDLVRAGTGIKVKNDFEAGGSLAPGSPVPTAARRAGDGPQASAGWPGAGR